MADRRAKGHYQVHYLIHAFRKGSEHYKAVMPMETNKTQVPEEEPVWQ